MSGYVITDESSAEEGKSISETRSGLCSMAGHEVSGIQSVGAYCCSAVHV